jgi:hypothetical protein
MNAIKQMPIHHVIMGVFGIIMWTVILMWLAVHIYNYPWLGNGLHGYYDPRIDPRECQPYVECN